MKQSLNNKYQKYNKKSLINRHYFICIINFIHKYNFK